MLPLPGPLGLYAVTHLPRFLSDSSSPGWRGAYFTEMVVAERGETRQQHLRLCVMRMASPVRRRALGGRSWQTATPALWHFAPGDDQQTCWQGRSFAQFLFVAPSRVDEILDGEAARYVGRDTEIVGGWRPSLSPLPARIFDALSADLRDGSPGGPLVGDSLITAFVAHVAAAPVAARKEAMTSAALRRVVDYVEGHLAAAVTLQQMAAEAGLGVRRFCTAFRESLGTSPHQYVLQQRVERAKRLIALGRPLAQVALESGFADQSALSRTFVRHVGLTPRAFREHGTWGAGGTGIAA